MIDTLKLFTTNLKMEPEKFPVSRKITHSGLSEQPTYKFEIICEGSPTSIKIEIKPDLRSTDGYRLFVNIASMSILMGHNNNIKTAWKHDLKPAFLKLAEKLEQYGIYTKVPDMNICRIDLACTVQTAESVSLYTQMFRASQFSRVQLHKYENQNLQFRGAQETINIYDKTEKLIKQRKLKRRNPNSDEVNLFRFEHQYRNAEKVQNYLGLYKISDISDQFEGLVEKLNTEVRSQLTGLQTTMNKFQQHETVFLNAFIRLLRHCKPRDLLKQIGLLTLLDASSGNTKKIFEKDFKLDDTEYNQKLKRALTNQIYEIQHLKLAFELRDHRDSISELNSQIQLAFRKHSSAGIMAPIGPFDLILD